MTVGGIPPGAARVHDDVRVSVSVPDPAPTLAARPRPATYSPTDAARAVELLGSGPLERVPGVRIGSNEAKHGQMDLYRVVTGATAPTAPDGELRTVLKGIGKGGAQEVFAHEIATAMGIDDLFPRVAWRADERAAAIELFDGRTAADFRISTGSALDDAFETMVRNRFPGLDDARVAHRAKVERQLVHVFDALLANGDRHPQNVLVNKATGELRFIDHGLINRYAAVEDGLVPTLRAAYAHGERLPDGTRAAKLLPEVQDVLRGLDQGAVRAAFDRMMQRIGGTAAIGQQAPPMTGQFLDDVLRRLESFAATGLVRVRLM